MRIELEVSEGGPSRRVADIELPAVPRVGDRIEYEVDRFGIVQDVTWFLEGAALLRLRGSR